MVKKAHSERDNAFTSLAQQFQSFYKLYDQLQPYLTLDEALKRYIDRRRSWVGRLHELEFPVAFLGSFTTGKSTISNALLGKNLLPENPQATTAVPTFIRHGEQAKATVYFLDADARRSLFNLYIQELERRISEKLPQCGVNNNPVDVLIKINDRLEEVKKHEDLAEEDLLALHYLVDHWEDDRTAVPIKLSELSEYVEDFSDIRLVDRIEITLPLPLPRGVVLVDLPGLGVANPRHRKITRDFVESEAKAFVICMKWNHLLEGEEIEVLEAIHRRNPRVLQRAFWLINQWDTANNTQRKQTRQNFNDRIQQKSFHIQSDRLFHVSALQYLLLRAKVEGTLDQSPHLKEHLDILENIPGYTAALDATGAKKLLKKHQDTAQFQKFHDRLIAYLEGPAEQEFLTDAKSELEELLRRFTATIEPEYLKFKGSKDPAEDLKQEFLFLEVKKRLDQINEALQAVAIHFRTESWPKIEVLTPQVQKRIEKKIRDQLKGLDQKVLLNELRRGMYIKSAPNRLMSQIEGHARIERIIMQEYSLSISEQVQQLISAPIRQCLQDQGPLPPTLVDAIDKLLEEQRFQDRAKGLADALMYDYNDQINEIGSRIAQSIDKTEQKADDRKFIKGGLTIFEKGILDFVKKLPLKANDKAKLSAKNYAEELFEELPAIFATKQAAIARMLSQADLFPSSLQEAIKKHRLIVDVFEQLIEFRQGNK